jgi:hypothetical protein
MSTDTDPITKIGTEVVGVRAVSGFIHHEQPDTIVLRRLYPGEPANIGVVDAIGAGRGRVAIYPEHQGEWSHHDRAALAAFFIPRYLERSHG